MYKHISRRETVGEREQLTFISSPTDPNNCHTNFQRGSVKLSPGQLPDTPMPDPSRRSAKMLPFYYYFMCVFPLGSNLHPYDAICIPVFESMAAPNLEEHLLQGAEQRVLAGCSAQAPTPAGESRPNTLLDYRPDRVSSLALCLLLLLP